MNFKLLKKVSDYIKKQIEIQKIEKEEERKLKRNITVDFIYDTLSSEYIEHFNFNLIMNSAGWLGGNYTATDIKIRILNNDSSLFVKEEYDLLRNQIEKEKRIADYENKKIDLDTFNLSMIALGDTSKQAFEKLTESLKLNLTK